MIRSVLSAIAFAVLVYTHAGGEIELTPNVGPAHRQTASFDSRLRSAFLLRATGMDRDDDRLPPAQQIERLNEHFDAVLELLADRRDASLEIALNRLETRRDEHWSASERDAWRQRLASERETNLTRLREYQVRRRFPINEHDDQRAVPVFVDHYDTACAVGHLMRKSGWTEAVAGIHGENNHVYVTDARDGPLVEWIAYSGLLQEEAALIQPGYEISPYSPAIPISTLTSPDSLPHGDLAIGRFAEASFFQRLSLAESDPVIKSILTSHGLEQLDFVPQSGPISVSTHTGPARSADCGDCGTFTPLYDTWFDVRGVPVSGGGLATARKVFGPPVIEDLFDLRQYTFEIVATHPDDRINSISLFSNYTIANMGFGGGGSTGFGFARMRITEGKSEGAQLGVATLESEPGSFLFHIDGRDTLAFTPQRRIRVEVTALAGFDYNIYALGHEVNVITVPEPAGWPSALSGVLQALLLACAARRWGVSCVDAGRGRC